MIGCFRCCVVGLPPTPTPTSVPMTTTSVVTSSVVVMETTSTDIIIIPTTPTTTGTPSSSSQAASDQGSLTLCPLVLSLFYIMPSRIKRQFGSSICSTGCNGYSISDCRGIDSPVFCQVSYHCLYIADVYLHVFVKGGTFLSDVPQFNRVEETLY